MLFGIIFGKEKEALIETQLNFRQTWKCNQYTLHSMIHLCSMEPTYIIFIHLTSSIIFVAKVISNLYFSKNQMHFR